MTVQAPLILGSNGRISQLPVGDTILGGGSASIGIPFFSTIGNAQSTDIPGTVNTVQLLGYNTPGDGGGGAYKRALSPPPDVYVGLGYGYPNTGYYPAVPPSITAGGIPVLVYATTTTNHQDSAPPYNYGPTTQPIFAGIFTFLVVMTAPAFITTPSLPSSITDTAGNVYLLASGASNSGSGTAGATAIYYCSNPLTYAPMGSWFNIATNSPLSQATIFAYQAPGFTGAVLSQTANALTSSSGGVSLSVSGMSGASELVIGAANVGRSLASGVSTPFTYASPAGWNSISPPNLGLSNPISCFVTNGASVTYNPTWSGSPATTTVVATFKTYPKAAIPAPSYWTLIPSWPIHTAAYGIDPSAPDNQWPFKFFNVWLGSIQPASGTNKGGIQHGSGTVAINGTANNPLYLTFGGPPDQESYPYQVVNRLSNGMAISFSGIGSTLPAPLVAGQMYYVQYGSVNADGQQTVRLSTQSIFQGGQQATTKGATLTVPSGGLAVQSGLISGFGTITQGSGYVSGPYTHVPLTGGSGSGAVADITVAAGAVTSVAISISQGGGYKVGDVVSASNFYLGGSGSGFSTTVSSISHSYSTYSEGWADIVLDPGVYYSSGYVAPVLGCGLKKWRLFGYGARLQTAVFFGSVPWNDVNANTAGSQIAFQTQIKSTDAASIGRAPDYVVLKDGNFALAQNFYVNSYVVVMCDETQGQNILANWNNYTFEYAKVRDNCVLTISSGTYNNSTGVIILTMPSLGGMTVIGNPTLASGRSVALFSLTGTGAFASLNGTWPVTAVTGSGPYTVTLGATAGLGASTITGGYLATGYILFYDTLQYSYRSTFPSFAGSVLGYSGITGPASICQLNDCFDQEVEIHGLSVSGTEELQYVGLLSLKMVNCDFFGLGFKTGPFPSTMRKYSAINCRFHNCISEVDKMIDYAEYIDCYFDWNSWLLVSSASVNKLLIDRCRMPGGRSTYSLQTPKNLVIRDSVLGGTLALGTVLGVIESILIENSTLYSTLLGNQASQYTPLTKIGRVPDLSFVGGTIKLPPGFAGGIGTWNPSSNVNPIGGWSVPGGKCCIIALIGTNTPIVVGSAGGILETFTVQDCYVDGSNNFCIDTDLAVLPSTSIAITGTISGTTLTLTAPLSPSDAVLITGMVVTGTGLPAGTTITADPGLPVPGGLPVAIGTTCTLSNSGGTGTTFTASVPMAFLPHPCPSLTVTNSTGGQFVADMSGAPPQIPLYGYFRRAYSGGAMSSPSYPNMSMRLLGNLSTCNINVTKPFTDTGTCTLTIYMFGWKIVSGNYYPTYVAQVINLKTAGSRTITAAGGTGLSGDTFTAVPFFLSGGHALVVSSSASTLAKDATFIITARAMQNIEYSGLAMTTSTSGFDVLADATMMAVIQ